MRVAAMLVAGLACVAAPAVAAGVSGTVVDASGAPVPDALVVATAAGQERRATTDTDGTFEIADLPDGPVDLRASAGGFADAVLRVSPGGSARLVLHPAPLVDAILLDSDNPALPVKELGGTGRTHDWTVSRRIRQRVPVPVILAGGLRADNVAEAIAAVRPAGVDLCSGVRTGGALDDAKLAAFFAAVRGAGAAGYSDGREAGRP